jgi:hypothetical protein
MRLIENDARALRESRLADAESQKSGNEKNFEENPKRPPIAPQGVLRDRIEPLSIRNRVATTSFEREPRGACRVADRGA